MPNTEQLLYQTDKSSHRGCSIKKAVLENSEIFTGKHLCWILFFKFIKKRLQHKCFVIAKFLRALTWRATAHGCFWSGFRKWLFGTLLLDSRFQNHPDSLIFLKHQSLSNQSFKHNSTDMLSLYLTRKLPFEPRCRMFVINGYFTKSKRL